MDDFGQHQHASSLQIRVSPSSLVNKLGFNASIEWELGTETEESRVSVMCYRLL